MVTIISDAYKKKRSYKTLSSKFIYQNLFDTNFHVLNNNLVLSFNYFALRIISIIDKTLSTIAPDKKIRKLIGITNSAMMRKQALGSQLSKDWPIFCVENTMLRR